MEPEDDLNPPLTPTMIAFLEKYVLDIEIPVGDPTPSPETLASIARAEVAFNDGNWDSVREEYRSTDTTPEARAAMVTKMLTGPGQTERLAAAEPIFVAHLLASATAEDLTQCTFLQGLPGSPSNSDKQRKAVDMLADALEFMSKGW